MSPVRAATDNREGALRAELLAILAAVAALLELAEALVVLAAALPVVLPGEPAVVVATATVPTTAFVVCVPLAVPPAVLT